MTELWNKWAPTGLLQLRSDRTLPLPSPRSPAPPPAIISQNIPHATVISPLNPTVEFSSLIAAQCGCTDPATLPHHTSPAPSTPMSTTMTTVLGTSNMRGASRQTRTNPTRTSKRPVPLSPELLHIESSHLSPTRDRTTTDSILPSNISPTRSPLCLATTEDTLPYSKRWTRKHGSQKKAYRTSSFNVSSLLSRLARPPTHTAPPFQLPTMLPISLCPALPTVSMAFLRTLLHCTRTSLQPRSSSAGSFSVRSDTT